MESRQAMAVAQLLAAAVGEREMAGCGVYFNWNHQDLAKDPM